MKYPLLTYLLMLAHTLPAQQMVAPSFDTITVEFEVWDTPYQLESEIMDTSRQDLEDYEIGNFLSFSGYARAATREMEKEIGEVEMDTARYTLFRDSFHAVGAIKALLADAEQHDITIVNEAHHEPRHRVFTRQLLQGLYDRGYRHFGLETLTNHARWDSLINTTNYPALNAGYYTREPQFAAMVDEAKRIGYRLFSYEDTGNGGPAMREQGQMENIVAYRSEHADGKLLLHVGYSHATEGNLGGAWERAMAQRLADTTGLDPLTINQTHFREMSDTVQERYEYRHFAPAETSIFRNRAGEDFNFDNEVQGFDRYVFHPRTTYLHGRPDYVFAFGQQAVFVDFSQIDTEGPWLVKAYDPDSLLAKEVPLDVVEMDNSYSAALALPSGNFVLLVTSSDGAQRITGITVE